MNFFLASTVIIAILITAFTSWRIWTHPRRTSNGLWLLATLVALWALTISVSRAVFPPGDLSVATLIGAAPFLIIPPIVVLTVVLLVANTGVVVRREGLRIATLVPAAIGGALLATVVAGFIALNMLTSDPTRPSAVGLFLTLVVLTPGAMLLLELIAYTVYAMVYGRIRRSPKCDAVIVLGCGLVGDKVSPLLAGRVDRGIREYRQQCTAGGNPLFVMSGGQGPDEPLPEAEAMARYATEMGVPRDEILTETESTTTEENLRFTGKLLALRGLDSPTTLVVTSDFHVLRSAALTRQLGVAAYSVGSRTAWYYLPSAFLREFAAIVVHYRKANALVVILMVALFALPLFGI